ncbi:MAG: ATP-binding cassette domain-containing protein [Actinophytocola sp.]|uniref:ABC transporter ATP-binding protein n=1 Tax=Actinophytocola sp. TaxID=1872138 RepID=UPI003C745080
MSDGSGRIVVQNLSKNFGQVAAVQNLSFQVEPGSVTGFLGPNGSGKTTTLRMLLGLVTPTAGYATINGQPFNRLGNPGRIVGGVLEAQGFHPGRTARDHLRVYGAAMGVPDQRADEVLNLVGLGAAGNRAAGGFSLGMKQRLALATALLGDPQVLVLDEPANGLDPEGIAWLRTFLKAFAQSGRTVLISSHLLAEVEQTIDQVVIISRGQTMYYGMLDELRSAQQSRVIVQPADPQKLAIALQEAKITEVTPTPDGKLAVVGATVQQIGDIAAQAGVALYGVQEERADLEQLFFALTSGQFSAPGQVAHGQLPPIPPGYQQQGYQQPGPQGYQQTPPQGYQQPQQGYQTPPGGWQQQQGTPPGGWQQPQQYQQQYQQPPQQGYAPPAQTPPGGWQQQPQPVQPPQPPQNWGQQPSGPQPVQAPPAPPPPPPSDQNPSSGGPEGGGN